jgi:lipopolysaccharide heptosyltransferase II
MGSRLQIYDRRERALVAAADAVLAAAARVVRLRERPRPAEARRILVLRLERIGDLVMALDAIAAVRATWPAARLDLAVGSWNADLARTLQEVDRVITLDASWLAREARGLAPGAMVRRALAWRGEAYDLAINLEGDIRSNLLLALSGAPVRVGFDMAGGGPLLTHRAAFDPRAHTATNTLALVAAAAAAFGVPLRLAERRWPRLRLPPEAHARADALLAGAGGSGGRPCLGLHTGGGRPIKQWPPRRFGEAISQLAGAAGAAVVLTGAASDRPLVDEARAAIAPGVPVVDLCGALDLPALAAVLARLDLYVTGDTGPMHLAAAMGTPLVAVFGLSDPARYAPLGPAQRIVRIDLWCSPCNRVRRPPARCQGRVPDCLEGIGPDMVVRAGLDLLRPGRRASAGGTDQAGAREARA